jgi:hypothetical protein
MLLSQNKVWVSFCTKPICLIMQQNLEEKFLVHFIIIFLIHLIVWKSFVEFFFSCIKTLKHRKQHHFTYFTKYIHESCCPINGNKTSKSNNNQQEQALHQYSDDPDSQVEFPKYCCNWSKVTE